MFFVKKFKVLIIAWFVVGFLLAPAAAVQQGKSYGDLCFPQIGSEADQKYLGVKGSGSFRLDQIEAPYLVLEVMRTSCPHCQKEAGGNE